uniref:SRCR domain-containing protein n=1 Tax=Electrophorus electricus TaxID=8005 RepID=A0A4W4GEE7_ELEEL
ACSAVRPLSKDSVRLMDGGGRCSGRVEVLHRGQWGTVCDDDWDMRDAAVVCRELGCGEAVDVLGNSHFGPGSGPIWMDDVDCSGSESTLKNCTSAGWGKHDCNQTKNAGVICSESTEFSLFFYDNTLGVRLVGGPRCSGRVEVLHENTWATVCFEDFDQQDAEVVCRELGCGPSMELLGAAAFGRGEGQVWTEELQCRGNESQINLCPKSSTLTHDCSHDNDVGLLCAGKKYMVRLVNSSRPCTGRVEILHQGQWGTVCDDDWDMRDAAVVCRELGCGEAVDVMGKAHFGPGSGPIWMNKVACSGSESTLKNCGSIKHDCSHDSDVGLVCAGKKCSVRLVDGGSRCAGRVEVLHRGQWGTVCVFGMSTIAAVVVCRELGCGEILRPIWMSHVDCSGTESTVKHCGYLGWGKHSCLHYYDAELICSGMLKSVCIFNQSIFY